VSGASLVLRCAVCHEKASIASRRAFSAFDDAHHASCGVRVTLTNAELDVLLDLPPEDR